MSERGVPSVGRTNFTVTARVELGSEPANGAIVSQQGKLGGWCLYLKDGVPTYAHNWVGVETCVLRATEAVGKGAHQFEMKFESDVDGADEGMILTFISDGKATGWGRVDTAVPALFSHHAFGNGEIDGSDASLDDYVTEEGTRTGSIRAIEIDISGGADSIFRRLSRVRRSGH